MIKITKSIIVLFVFITIISYNSFIIVNAQNRNLPPNHLTNIQRSVDFNNGTILLQPSNIPLHTRGGNDSLVHNNLIVSPSHVLKNLPSINNPCQPGYRLQNGECFKVNFDITKDCRKIIDDRRPLDPRCKYLEDIQRATPPVSPCPDNHFSLHGGLFGGLVCYDTPRTFEVIITEVKVNDDHDSSSPGEWWLYGVVNQFLLGKLDDGTMGDADDESQFLHSFYLDQYKATVTVPGDTGIISVHFFGDEEDGCEPPVPSMPDWVVDGAGIIFDAYDYPNYAKYLNYAIKGFDSLACFVDPGDKLGTIDKTYYMNDLLDRMKTGYSGLPILYETINSNIGDYTVYYRIIETKVG